jgi:hypothetical protein
MSVPELVHEMLLNDTPDFPAATSGLQRKGLPISNSTDTDKCVYLFVNRRFALGTYPNQNLVADQP